MKEFFAREFLWFIIALVVAVPVGLGFMWLMGFTAENEYLTTDEEAFIIELYLVGFMISFIGVYIVRFIPEALVVLAKAKEKTRIEIKKKEAESVEEIIPTRMLKDEVQLELGREKRVEERQLFLAEKNKTRNKRKP